MYVLVLCACGVCLYALSLSLGSDQELHADAAEGCGVLPHPLHYAQGEATQRCYDAVYVYVIPVILRIVALTSHYTGGIKSAATEA